MGVGGGRGINDKGGFRKMIALRDREKLLAISGIRLRWAVFVSKGQSMALGKMMTLLSSMKWEGRGGCSALT